jgi:uncharacterized membrane protein
MRQPAQDRTGVASAGTHGRRRLGWAGFWLGFGLAMFFDGILLHQILQWHHLFSGIAPYETASDLRFQVMADGVFHLVTYALTALGLWLLWSARHGLGDAGAGRRLVAFGLIGFGAWHVADAVLSHWILGLHRIRMDVADPLVWDLLWLAPFGLGAVALGLWLLRRPGGGKGHAGRTIAGAFALLAVGAGAWSLRPPPDAPGDRALVVFRPGMGLPEVVAAAEAVGGLPVWSDSGGGVWLIALDPGARPSALYRHGALMVSGGPVSLGCLGWARV